jgi:hypothetical protein
MEYLIDLKFEDPHYNALVHFVATFTVKNANEARAFIDELIAGFKRKNVEVYPSRYYRIDNDLALRKRSYEYYNFFRSISTASVEIEQFFIEEPNQTKSLIENLTEKFFGGEDSIANIGEKYNLPVRVLDKESKNPLYGDIYYFSVEHLIPKE